MNNSLEKILIEAKKVRFYQDSRSFDINAINNY